jgi:cell division protein ZapA
MAYKIELLGQEFTLRTDIEAEEIAKLSQFLRERVKEIMDQTQTASNYHVAVLALLNIGHDYLQLKAEHEALLKQLNEKSEHLIRKMEGKR